MGNTAWKQHERIVARYFGVERGRRGDHFGQEKSCEVVAKIDEWDYASRHDIKNGTTIYNNGFAGVVVECKQGYSKKPVEIMREAHLHNPDPKKRHSIVSWGDFAMTWMTDRSGFRTFDRVWNRYIFDKFTLAQASQDVYIEWPKLQVPKYLNDFYAQAQEYVEEAEKQFNGGVFPLVALHAKGLQGRIIVWRM